jgi:hypothetical protein
MKKVIVALLLFTCVGFYACQKNSVEPTVKQITNTQQTTNSTAAVTQTAPQPDTAGNNVNGWLKLQLEKDAINTDNIVIAFNPSASPAYVPGEDAPTLQGFGQVSLSSFSSDNIALAINNLPLTNKGLSIGLKVNATKDGIYQMQLLQVSGVPSMYAIWLKDGFKKDSLDMSMYPSYAFNIYKADTSSFGSHRFKLVIRQK